MLALSKTKTNLDFEKTFKEFYSPLCNFAYSLLPDHDLCEDLVQDVFLKIWDKSPDINTSISSYLYQAVKNSCFDHMRKSYKQSIIPIEEIEDPIDSPYELNREKDLTALNKKIEKAINSLPPKCKEIFLLRRNFQMSYNEISIELNISKKTIENHMNSAIKKLRTQLSKSDFLIYFFFLEKK
ncbi:RNA polymerase sigma-70 factor [Labilibaculum sp. K2S]|uniref:RNA polymerase sigma-70 factor n=1 Tax=Labilibaculum sp. K2S TaxID=3056386 RepID=UPI0025A3DBAA|nr:RNA polymerase sigma-70 factor [Labilibaculum sp. K2S]MDM8159527.1 RNA polymerase sigma-70 factor [Labilibaculum sp. K2S]